MQKLKHHCRAFTLQLALLVLAAVSPVLADETQVLSDWAALRTHIQEQNQKYMDYFNAADAAGVASMYMEDGILVSATKDVAKGREAILAATMAEQAGVDLNLSLETKRLAWIHGDQITEEGRWVMDVNSEGAEPMTMDGHYVVIWKLQTDGQWLMDLDAIYD